MIYIETTAEEYLPVYATDGSAGADLKSTVDYRILPGETRLIPTGLRFAIPVGYEVQIRPRSGLAFKHNVTVANAPGTIDSDYRGDVMVMLHNFGRDTFVISKGDRIAQMVVAKVRRAHFEITDKLDETSRGEGGFGSTGTK